MKKKTLSAILTLVMLLALCAPAFAANVVLSPQNLTVDGKAVTCEKYNIGGANYFKLRDLAQALSGTSSHFEVGWDGATGTVSITTGKAYTSVGGELSAGADKSSTAQVSRQTIQINGVTRSDLSAYNIGGANFFKLRDLGTALGFGVDFDAGTNTAVVTSGAVTVAGTDKSSMLAAAVYRKASILNDTSAPTIAGTTYYVSNGGSDSNDGKTPQTAWATLNKVNGASLKAGDGVLFERGGVFRGYLIAQTGVTYAAYGTGAKPTISGSPENGAGAGKWSLYGETPDGGKVWVYYRDMVDCGTIVFNGGASCADKQTPKWSGSGFVNDNGGVYDVRSELKYDLSFFSPADSLLRGIAGVGSFRLYEEKYVGTSGKLYLRCDKGNPGEVFDSIEFSAVVRGAGHGLVAVETSGVIFNNLHITCNGDSGVMGGDGAVVQNCDIDYMGGCVWGIDNGETIRAGDAFTVAGPMKIENCYIHDNADNGVTIECAAGGESTEDLRNKKMSDITVSGCLFERNYNGVHLMCFTSDMKAAGVQFRDILIEDNIILSCSESWSGREYHGSPGTCIRIGDADKPMWSENLVVRGNYLYSPKTWALLIGCNAKYDPPTVSGNHLYFDAVVHHANWRDDHVAALWESDGSGEFKWYWPDDKASEQFLNGYLGSGNVIHIGS